MAFGEPKIITFQCFLNLMQWAEVSSLETKLRGIFRFCIVINRKYYFSVQVISMVLGIENYIFLPHFNLSNKNIFKNHSAFMKCSLFIVAKLSSCGNNGVVVI